MKHTHIFRWTFWSILAIQLLAVSCSQNMDDYYQEPAWLKGSIYEVLQKRGNYSIFLKGIDRAGFKPMVSGKSILTVMAPNDSAFSAYLKEQYGAGTTIDNLSETEVKKLIGFHILYYAFDKNMLINFRPNEGDGATLEEQNIGAGLYYKHRTKSQDPITIEKDTSGKDVNVYHLERFLPVFSYRMFQTKQIDADYNYTYFFPATPWKGATGFNVSNASVNDYSVLSDNGYVYTIDRVLKPLETIYNELSSNDNYSDFLKLYNKYGYYQEDNNLSLEYGNGLLLYQHYHTSPLANIALEWPVTDYTQVADLAYKAYSVFAPDNLALKSFFNEYWKVGGYDSLYEVSKQSIEYLLYNCVYPSSIVFPEEITKGRIINSYGTKIKFNVENVPVGNRKMCVNGSLYGCNELTPPAMFGSVTGPAFQYKKYSIFLKMLTNADLVMTLCSDATNYFMLYPSDEIINGAGITVQNELLYRGTTKLGNSAQQNYVYTHVASLDGITGNYTSLPTGSGNYVFRTLSPNMVLYWYMHDGKITNSIKFDELLYTSDLTEDDVFCDLDELSFRTGWTNGKCYAYHNTKKSFLFEGSLDNANYAKFVPLMIGNRNDESKLFYGFIQLLTQASLVNTTTQSITGVNESCLMFVPTTAAIKNAIIHGTIPGITSTNTSVDDAGFFANCTVTDATALKYYLMSYFIPLSTATISNYPYVGWEEKTTGGLPTLQTYDVEGNSGTVSVSTKMNV
ncbi:MAG: fasciclin domain-containing protein, partial [Bacteroidota bacterium]|nr:fasciclin domain-containing protein [Bacteroidota bacterium]